MAFLTARTVARDVGTFFALLEALGNKDEVKKLAADIKAESEKAVEAENRAAKQQQVNQAKEAELTQREESLNAQEVTLQKALDRLAQDQQAVAANRKSFESEVEAHRVSWAQMQRDLSAAKAAEDQRQATFTRAAQQKQAELERLDAEVKRKQAAVAEQERVFNRERAAWNKRVDEIQQLAQMPRV